MAATNLYEYYQSQGQALPTWQERAPIYEKYGLGSTSSYTGTEQQNQALLQKLISGQTVPTAPATTPTAITTSTTPREATQSNFSYLQNFTSTTPYTTQTQNPNITQTPQVQPTQPTQPSQTTPTQTPTQTTQPTQTPTSQTNQAQSTQAPQINNTSQMFQGIVNSMNQILQNPQVQQMVSSSPELQAQIAKINGLDSTIKTGIANAQNAYAQGNYMEGNSFTAQVKQAQDELAKLQTEAHSKLQGLSDAITTASQKPQSETDLETQYADIQTRLKQYDLETQKRVEAQYGLGSPLSVAQTFATKEQKNAELGRQGLQLEEQNTLLKLNLAQANRQLNVDIATKGYDRAVADYNRKIGEIEKKVAGVEKLQTAHKNTVDSIASLASSALDVFEQNNDEMGGVQMLKDLSQQYNIDPNYLLSAIQSLRVKEKSWSEPYDLPGVGQVQRNAQTGEIRGLKPTVSPGTDLLGALRELKYLEGTAVSPGQVVNAKTNLPVKLSNEQSGKVADFQNLLSRVDVVQGLLNDVQSTGAIKGWILKEGIYTPIVQRTLNAKELELMQELARISNQYVYLVSGKQINEQEFVRLSRAIPDIRATKEANETVMKNFRSYLQGGLNNFLRVNGWKLAGEETPSQSSQTTSGTTSSGIKWTVTQ